MAKWSATATFSLKILLPLLLAVSLLPTRDATREGDALFTMMGKWSVEINGWVSGGDPCAELWNRTRCRDGRVVYLNLTNTGIQGSLPPEIGVLEKLEVLDLSNVYHLPGQNNSLSGPFPDAFANCKNLKSFNGSNLEWKIEFPKVLTTFTMLEELYISTAELRGTFPEEFFDNLGSLRSLFIGDNDLTADLKKFSKMTSLVLLTMYKNEFNQLIPSELGNLKKLQYLNLHTTQLYGSLPDSFKNLNSLQNLTMQRNNITGSIPESWSGMTQMRAFRMDQNFLSGDFPAWMFTSWRLLDYLNIGSNSMSGPNPNIDELEKTYNVSYDFWTLKWDCNYFNGSSPCSPGTPNCSQELLSKTSVQKPTFDFDKNCYANSPDLWDKVGTDCVPYHPIEATCSSFYDNLKAGRCPACPENQVPWPEAGKCVCTVDDSDGSSGVPIGAVVGGAVALVVVFLIIIAFILYKRRKQFQILDFFTISKPKEADDCWEVPPGVTRFSKQDLTKLTHDFDDKNMIGQGGFGKVFVGTLDNGKMVAIKRASAGSLQGTFEFHNEVTLLSRLHHRHLVKLEGFCDEDGLQILIYEFMKGGNLHTHLLNKVTNTPLHWYRRLEIAYGIAQGLEYLHSFANPPVIHRDVKPSNILLDEHMVAKLADFGISKVSPAYDTHVSTRPAGTAGYLDPDYFMRRQLTTASDVYAFGVVMLELVTGQEAIDHTRLEEFNLIEWVKKRFRTSGVISIVDPLIETDYSVETLTEMTKLGLRCASFDRNDRPTMKAVLAMLEPLMVLQALYPEDSGKDKKNKEVHIAFDSEYLVPPSLLDTDLPADYPLPTTMMDNTTTYPVPRSLIDRTTKDHSNPSEVGPNVQLMHMSGALRPR